MHILIAILTALGGLIWALYRLQASGVDLNAFNPFYWLRRRRWAKQLGTKPLHRIEDPMEAAATLVVAMAQLDAPVTLEHKQSTTQLFMDEFGIDQQAAAQLYSAGAYLLKDVMNIVDEIKPLLAPTKERFQPRHVESLLAMLKQTSQIEAAHHVQEKANLLRTVEREFSQTKPQASKW